MREAKLKEAKAESGDMRTTRDDQRWSEVTRENELRRVVHNNTGRSWKRSGFTWYDTLLLSPFSFFLLFGLAMPFPAKICPKTPTVDLSFPLQNFSFRSYLSSFI